MNKQKGFTIIELIVVIAVIAVLAAIVLVNVTQYLAKGKDAAAKADLDTLLANGAVYYDANANFNDFFTTSGVKANTGWTSIHDALTTSSMNYTIVISCDRVDNCSGGSVDTPDTAWCVMITEKAATNTYCVDSSGGKIEKAVSAGGTCNSGVCH